uniref:Uncharacterized protein n=1 Tax=Anthurium amnicola TaxID=1678845 RepID=A0A1D1Y753_9ARAE
MAMGFSRVPWWWLVGGGGGGGGKGNLHQEYNTNTSSVAYPPPVGTSPDSGAKVRSGRPRRRKWRSREERWGRVDRELDLAVVPSDGGGGCLSGSESDGPDLSVGWLEPHAPGFLGDAHSDVEGYFAVLVPCYERCDGGENPGPGVAVDSLDGYSSEGKKNVELWLSSLQNS